MKRKIFVLGDSISIEYGPYLRECLGKQFDYDRKRGEEALIDLNQPVGANGGDSNCVLEYLREQTEMKIHYDILLLNCGLHDIRTNIDTKEKQVPQEVYRNNLENIMELCSCSTKKTIWISTTPVDDAQHAKYEKTFRRYNEDIKQYNKIAENIMGQYKIPIIDLYGYTIGLGNQLYYDHVHYREEIRALQGAFIAENIRLLLQSEYIVL
ncbi:SGNH/GDSL hydrolase family protein [Geosporobacter ferrireducens]|uniref:Lipase n=1 Tax=Geosporobacter ferrireducens TaxID=1424294 RepID=A0A1D8GK29_9FIRM|nr:SGNH/GDSL hydrolase family protein [Geosporobacter ferrireducens]AOT71267.1 hypothetical protein Gferi_17925 [Geosporobacter ferrireducens]MTI58080.1 SGNH/GDSL hydrolase family protein [Geosporobacter ferrireducens]